MASDGGLRGIFRTKLVSGFHWQSVETGLTGPGTPDSNFAAEGVERWVEFKQASDWAPQIKIEQIGWHKHRHAAGGISFIATRRKHDGGPRKGPPVDELWICLGKYLGILNSERMRSENIRWVGIWRGGPSNWNWDEVRSVLTASRENLELYGKPLPLYT